MKNVRFDMMRPEEIISEKKRCPVVYLPVGPLEWHGPHLPLGTDSLIAQEIALRVVQKTGGVVLPPFFWGTERERDTDTLRNLGFQGDEWIIGMDFPENSLKSLYFPEDFFALAIRAWLELLVCQDYRLIVIINGHGATNQIQTLERLAKEFTNERKVTVLTEFVAVPDESGVVDYGHASAAETSKMMAIHPKTVDLNCYPSDKPLIYKDWAVVDSKAFLGNPDPNYVVRDDPRNFANPRRGEELLKYAVDQIAEKVLHQLNTDKAKEIEK